MAGGYATCPECGRLATAIKRYTMPRFVLFLGVAWFQQRATYTQCAPCMRWTIVENAVINVLPANLLWVLILFPWYSILFLLTFTAGHSDGVTLPAAGPEKLGPIRSKM